MNAFEKRYEQLNLMLKENKHLENKESGQRVWDAYLRLIRYTRHMDDTQKMFMTRAKRVLLGNRKWIS